MFRHGRGCMDQVFAISQVCEKYPAIGKDVFCVFMDLEKAYDAIDQHCLRQMLRVYGVGGNLCRVFMLIVERVSGGMDVSEWFPVHVRLRQGCVMSPWLFNVCMDGVVREVNVRVLGKLVGTAECKWRQL